MPFGAASGEVLLSVEEMYRADAAAMAAGVPGPDLMERAGRAVAEAAQAVCRDGPVVVLCGPGNNGGDGFVAARHLKAAGRQVKLTLLGAREALRGDAAHHAALWDGPVLPLDTSLLDDAAVVIDALFGAGLARGLEGAARDLVEAVNNRRLPAVAVDVPSGLAGDSGAVVGDCALAATRTVTFFRRKPGHLLQPGRRLCGAVTVADIGIPASVLSEIAPSAWRNDPALWDEAYPRRMEEQHKYAFGHALVVAGTMSGASRLAGLACQRVGAGLTSIAAPVTERLLYQLTSPCFIVRDCAGDEGLSALLSECRYHAVMVGQGGGVRPETKTLTLAALDREDATVLDADGLSVFADAPERLFEALRANSVLTPHEGEFRRLFPDLSGDKLSRARAAARRSGAVVLLKGSDTVVAEPSGRATINDNAPAWLATAGAGDVLTGMIGGLLAQGMPAFAAAGAAAWLHGAAASAFGPGLIASDLIDRLPAVTREFLRRTP